VFIDYAKAVSIESYNFTWIECDVLLQYDMVFEATEERRRRRSTGLYFQLSLFFRQYADAAHFRSSNGEDHHANLSYYSNHRRRWTVLPLGFAQKGIYDADGCTEMFVHWCAQATASFAQWGKDTDGSLLVTSSRMPESVGVIHHYRRCCHMDADIRFGRGYCQNQTLYYDDTIAGKFGDQLNRRLAVEFARLGLRPISSMEIKSGNNQTDCN
jgi:hypothetical protein